MFGTWTLVLFPHAGVQSEIFQGRVGFVELAHFSKHFVKNTRKKGPAGKNLELFLQNTVKTTFRIKNLTQRWIQSGPFFAKLGHFFEFSKKDRRGIMFLTEFCCTLFTKTLLLFCISLLSFIYRSGNTSQILLGATTPVMLSKN